MAVYSNYLRDRTSKIGILIVLTLIVQFLYTIVVRPGADAWTAEQIEKAKTTPGYRPERSLYVIIAGPEQEATIIIATWAMILSLLRFNELRHQRQLLSADLMNLPPGIVIVPEDCREYLRRLDQLPVKAARLRRAARARAMRSNASARPATCKTPRPPCTTSARAKARGSMRSSRSCGSASGPRPPWVSSARSAVSASLCKARSSRCRATRAPSPAVSVSRSIRRWSHSPSASCSCTCCTSSSSRRSGSCSTPSTTRTSSCQPDAREAVRGVCYVA